MPPSYPPEKTCIKNEIGYHGENIAEDTENTGGIQMEPKLTIVIPIYNEAESLEEILRQIAAVEICMEKELILVDDCSTDGTRDILKRIEAAADPSTKIFYHDVNQGKGATLRTGFQHITGDITLIQDADLEYGPSDYPKLLQPILAIVRLREAWRGTGPRPTVRGRYFFRSAGDRPPRSLSPSSAVLGPLGPTCL